MKSKFLAERASVPGLIENERKRYELVRRKLQVVKVAYPAPQMVRVTLGGSDLKGFQSASPSDHIKVFFPNLLDSGAEVMRDYTPLEFRNGANPELDIDIVVHGEAGNITGPAAFWATKAQTGDALRIGGPRGSYIAPEGITEAVLLGDESALPAIKRWLKKFNDIAVRVLLITESEGWQDYLTEELNDNHAVTWFNGDDREEQRLKTLQEIKFSPTTFVYMAGEATGLVPMRRYLRRELMLDKVQVKAEGFWKKGQAEYDHHAPLDETDPD